MPKVAFRTKLKAWWEGYDLPDRPAGPRPSGKPTERPYTRDCRFSPDVETAHLLFGQGRMLPLEADPLSNLPAPLDAGAGAVVLLLGGETGGPVTVLGGNHGFQLSVLEPDRQRLHVCREILRDAGMGERIKTGPVDLENVELSSGRFHVVVSRLMLHGVANRHNVYRKLERTLRRGGQAVFTQFVAGDGADIEAVEAEMTSRVEPERPTLLTERDELRRLTESGLRSYAVEDATERSIAQASEAFGRWQATVETIAQYREQARMLQELVSLVEHWQIRLKLMQSGQLRVLRIQAAKLENELL